MLLSFNVNFILGGCAVDDGTLQKCIQAALVRHQEVSKLLDEVTEDVER